METRRRTIAKAITWQVMGLIVMTAITYSVTGSLTEGSVIAMSGAASGIVFYVLHERVWSRIAWGTNRANVSVRHHATSPAQRAGRLPSDHPDC